VQAPLGFSAGLPYALTGGTLTAWMTSAGVNTTQVAVFLLIALPGNLKFLWAPLLDRYPLRFLGHRRGWLLVTQVSLAIALLVLARADPLRPISIGVLALSVAFLAATQNVLVDAYRTDALRPSEVGRGASAYVIGFRAGMIVAGGAALMLADHMPWGDVYRIMAGVMAVCTVATLLAPRTTAPSIPASLKKSFVDPLREFFGRPGARYALLFLMLYKFGDGIAIGLVNAFLVEHGYTGTEIGASQQFLGLGVTILGVAVGGPIVDRLGIKRSLVVFGLAQALANSGYVYLALCHHSTAALATATAIDSLFTGLATAAFVALITALCHRSHSATQYALFTAATTLLVHTVGAGSGWVIENVGWAIFFVLTALVALPALPLVRFLPLHRTSD